MKPDAAIFDLDGTLWNSGQHPSGIFPFVYEGLHLLSQKYTLYIVSNCPDGYIESVLKSNGLEKLIHDHECIGRTGKAKTDNIRDLIQRNKIRSAIYIGDSDGDRRAARENGLSFLFAGYSGGDCKEWDYKANSFKEATQILLDL